MRVPNNTTSESMLSQLQRLNSRQAHLQTQVSTGQRITLPSDDPAATARVLGLQTEQQQIQQFTRNGDRALSISESSYTAIEALKRLSDRAGELAVLGSGATSPAAFQSYATELDQLIEQGLQTVNTSNGNERLFGGMQTDAPPFTAARDSAGKVTGVTYGGTATAAEFRIAEDAKLSPYTQGATNAQFGAFVNNLVALRDAMRAADGVAVRTAQTALHTSEDQILTAVSDVGALQTRLEGHSAQNAARFSQLEKLTSAEVDVDLAETIVKLTQTQTAYQAALQAGAQVLGVSLLDYLR